VADALIVDHLQGARAGERQVVPLKDRIKFGRHPSSDVAFDTHKDLDASSSHAELRREAGGWAFVDVGSSNGSFVGGARVTQVLVTPGQPLEVGFGPNGPRVRLTIGDPLVPATIFSAHTPDTVHDAPVRKSGRTTMFHVVEQALQKSTRRMRMVIVAITVMSLAAMTALVIWNLRMDRGAPAASAPPAEAGPRIVRENRAALFLLASRDPVTLDEVPMCTAFAVARRHLLTNAHCAVEIGEARTRKAAVFAVQNGDPKVRLEIVGLTRHPDFRERDRRSIDVAVIEVDQDLKDFARLAGTAELRALEVGASMFTYGFPGRISSAQSPEATLTGGTIGRMTALDGSRAAFERSVLVQHSAFAVHGTSGSPVFDTAGRVIAINTGAYVGERSEALSGYNVAIRVDVAVELLGNLGVTVGGAPPP
jgi:V8-like Glu-specific endopeptidase